jgi:hypothetical protein
MLGGLQCVELVKGAAEKFKLEEEGLVFWGGFTVLPNN